MSQYDATLPRPVYGCAAQGCAEETSWPPEDLQWYDGQWCEDGETVPDPGYGPGFYCAICLDDIIFGRPEWDGLDGHLGDTLADEQTRRVLSR